VRFLVVEAGADVHHRQDAEEQAAIHKASERGHAEVIKILMAAGADVEGQDANGATPLMLAVENVALGAMEALLKMRADAGTLGAVDGRAALHRAAHNGSVDALKMLIGAGANVNQLCEVQRMTPLEYATSSGRVEAVEALIGLGAKTAIHDRPAEPAAGTVLHMAAEADEEHCLRLTALFLASGSPADVKRKVDAAAPIHLAAALGKSDVVQELIVKGQADAKSRRERRDEEGKQGPELAASVNMASLQTTLGDGATALHLAAASGSRKTCRVLLERGQVEIDAVDKMGKTPLHWAAAKGANDVVQFLLEKKASISTEDRSGRMPLHAALAARREDTTLILLKDARADPDAAVVLRSSALETPLLLAARGAMPKAVKALLEAGASEAGVDQLGRSAVYFVAKYKLLGEAGLQCGPEHMQGQMKAGECENMTLTCNNLLLHSRLRRRPHHVRGLAEAEDVRQRGQDRRGRSIA